MLYYENEYFQVQNEVGAFENDRHAIEYKLLFVPLLLVVEFTEGNLVLEVILEHLDKKSDEFEPCNDVYVLHFVAALVELHEEDVGDHRVESNQDPVE